MSRAIPNIRHLLALSPPHTPPSSPPPPPQHFHPSPTTDSLSQPASLPSSVAARYSMSPLSILSPPAVPSSTSRASPVPQSAPPPSAQPSSPSVQTGPTSPPPSVPQSRKAVQIASTDRPKPASSPMPAKTVSIAAPSKHTSDPQPATKQRPKKRRAIPNHKPTAARLARAGNRPVLLSVSAAPRHHPSVTSTSSSATKSSNNASNQDVQLYPDSQPQPHTTRAKPKYNTNGLPTNSKHLAPLRPPDDQTLSSFAKSHLRYGTFGLRAGFLRQDSRPLAFLPMKTHRYARLQGTLLSLAKGPYGEVIWSFDVAGSVVETAADDRKIIIYIVDSQRKKRRVMVLTAPDGKSFLSWSLWLSRASKAVLEMHYSMHKLISKGSFARVVLGKDLHTGEQVAIKLIEKSNAPPSERKYFEREVKIMQTLSHINIVKCYDVFDSRLRTRIVMEYVEGGTLSDLINANKHSRIPEHIVKSLTKDILAGVRYLHDNGTIHRDLKPDNCLLSRRKAPYGPVKIADFGLASMVDSGRRSPGSPQSQPSQHHQKKRYAPLTENGASKYQPNNTQKTTTLDINSNENIDSRIVDSVQPDGVLSSAVGSPAFVAPEIFEARYGTAVDMWSCGVIVFMMLSGGAMPFKGSSTSEMIRHAKKGEIEFDAPQATAQGAPPLRAVSDQAKAFVRALLNGDTAKRLTAKQALAHPWLRNVDINPAG